MGLFDFWRKKPPTIEERNAAELAAHKAHFEELDRKHARNLESIDWSAMLPGNHPISLSEIETDFLGYVDGLSTNETKIAKRWTEAGIDFQPVLLKFFGMGLVEWASVEVTLQRMKAAELKEFLAGHNMSVSGKKSVLVDRVLTLDIEELRRIFPATSVSITDRGRQVVERKRKKDRDEKFRVASQNARIHLQEGNLAAYGMDLRQQSEVLFEEGKYETALDLSLVHFSIEAVGVYDVSIVQFYKENKSLKGNYRPVPAILPFLTTTIEHCMDKLGLDQAALKARYLSVISDDQIPFHSFTAKEGSELLILALEDWDAAQKKAEQYGRRFARREGL